MLSNYGLEDYQLIQGVIAQKLKECVFEDLDIIEEHYPIFDIHLRLYDTVKAVVGYDRGIVGMFIMREDERIYLGRFTEKKLVKGFDTLKPEALEHNIEILDEVARGLSGRQGKES